MGARDIGPWLVEPKPLGKTPFPGNPSPEMIYLPICAILGQGIVKEFFEPLFLTVSKAIILGGKGLMLKKIFTNTATIRKVSRTRPCHCASSTAYTRFLHPLSRDSHRP